MSWRNSPIWKQALQCGAALLVVLGSRALAGEHVRAGKPLAIRSQPVSIPIARAVTAAETVSVVVASPPQSTTTPIYVDIRGPDGQVRRFPVEGGRASIQYRQVILHVGERLTILWTIAK
jgi:hypothetical protein